MLAIDVGRIYMVQDSDSCTNVYVHENGLRKFMYKYMYNGFSKSESMYKSMYNGFSEFRPMYNTIYDEFVRICFLKIFCLLFLGFLQSAKPDFWEFCRKNSIFCGKRNFGFFKFQFSK